MESTKIVSILQTQFGANIGMEEVSPRVFRIYAPFFHEDGDMLSVYLDLSSDHMLLRDFGNTLMRVSYTFDIESENKQKILDNIVKSNYGILDKDEILMHTNRDSLAMSIYQYSQIIAKVSNISILQREVVKSMFFEYLSDFIDAEFRNYSIARDVSPTSDKSLLVDYVISAPKPIYMFGVNNDSKASKTIISCLSFQRVRTPFRSLIVHEDIEALSVFNKRQIINVADKQFDSLESFTKEGVDYLEREIA